MTLAGAIPVDTIRELLHEYLEGRLTGAELAEILSVHVRVVDEAGREVTLRVV